MPIQVNDTINDFVLKHSSRGNDRLIATLIDLLDRGEEQMSQSAYYQLVESVHIFDSFDLIVERYRKGSNWAKQLLKDWAEEKWLTRRSIPPSKFTAKVFKVPYLITADMLSPSAFAFNRSDIALHAQSFLCHIMPDAIKEIQSLRHANLPIIFVADEIDTTKARFAQRHAALQSLLWHIQAPKLQSPLSKGMIISNRVDQQFSDMAKDQGMLLLIANTDSLKMGDSITVQTDTLQIIQSKKIIPFVVPHHHWRSVWRMGGTTKFELGKTLTNKSKIVLNDATILSKHIDDSHYTLAQKIVGRSCGLLGMPPKTSCYPIISVAETGAYAFSDTTNFRSTYQSVDLLLKTYQGRTNQKEGKSVHLKTRDGWPHAFMNRLILPNTLHLSADPYTRCPLGLGLRGNTLSTALIGNVDFRMPESIKIQFHEKQNNLITVRDLVHAIPYFISQNKLFEKEDTVKQYIIEIEGLPSLSVEEAYEFTESIGQYGAIGCTIKLSLPIVVDYLQQNEVWLERLVNEGAYANHVGLKQQLQRIRHWLNQPDLLTADTNAHYAKTLTIDCNAIREPLLASIKEPNKILTLSQAQPLVEQVDAVHIGSTAIDIKHYRVVAELLSKHTHPLKAELRVTPSSTMMLKALMKLGDYQIYGQKGVHTEMPENASCTRTHVKAGSTLITTSGRAALSDFSTSCYGYITSPELATITAMLGRLPTVSEYQAMLLQY